jgi:hypothetical protein
LLAELVRHEMPGIGFSFLDTPDRYAFLPQEFPDKLLIDGFLTPACTERCAGEFLMGIGFAVLFLLPEIIQAHK